MMAFPFPTDERDVNRFFRFQHRPASPILKEDSPEAELHMEVTEDSESASVEAEYARTITTSIDRLTDIARRDSFSSISSFGQRQQFKTALGSLQSTLFGKREATPTAIMDPHAASGSMDSDQDYEHLEAPDPNEMAKYHSSKKSKMSEHHHETSPSHAHHDPDQKGFGDYAEDLKHKGQEFVEAVQDKSAEYAQSAKDMGHDLLEQGEEYLHQAQDKGRDLFGQSEDASHDFYEKAQDKGHELKEDVKEAGHQAHSYLEEAEDKGERYIHEAQNRGHDLLDLVQDRGHEFAEQAKDKSHELADNVEDYYHKTENKVEDLVDLNSPDSQLPEDIHDEHHHIEDAAPRQIVDDLFNDPPVPAAHHVPRDPSPVRKPSPVHHEIEDNVNEEIPPAVRHSPLTDDRSDIEAGIESAVNDTHDEVDAIFDRLRSASPPVVPEQYSPSGDSDRDTVGRLIGEVNDPEPQMPVSDSLSGMREISPDEQTFDRRGPLTIPDFSSAPPQSPPTDEAPSAPPVDDDYEQESPHSHFDDMPVRPPTPPKDLNDDFVQPSSIDLGPPTHVHEKKSDSGLKPILKHGSGQPWFDFKTVDPKVLDILYWRDAKRSGIALGVILTVLFLVTKFSLISLLAYGSLAVLVGTLGFRIFKIVEAKIQKTEATHPFQPYLEKELEVPQERVHAQVDVLVEHGRNVANQLKRLFLVENVCESIKFGLLLYTLTYVGSWFSGFALIIIFVIGLFTVPKVYEVYKEPIDANLALVKEHLDKVHHAVGEKVPFLNKCCPSETAVKKEE